MQLVEQLGGEVLSDCFGTSTHTDVLSICSRPRLLERRFNFVSDKNELSSAFHHDRIVRVMCEHERLHMIRRLVSPPSFPVVVGPRAATLTAHIWAKNP